MMRLACDTGGTFTDLLVEDREGAVRMFKAATTPEDPVEGVLASLRLAASDSGEALEVFLRRAEVLVHGTTHAINAVVTGRVAKTAFLTTEGHPDILIIREGGRLDPFDHEGRYPAPYVPRNLTFEIPGRMDYLGRVLTPLDEAAVRRAIVEMKELAVEAIACCFLWSISNPAHELRVGQLLEAEMPGVPYTLSHQLNPTLREYRRAASAALDASLKPIMARYLGSLLARLRDAGFQGRLLVQTSQGGMADAQTLALAPIHSLNSGPALAPIAGRAIGTDAGFTSDIIVADTGGTTYDVSLVRNGRVPMTRETWIGTPYQGHMTGFPSVDVKSIGAGGGSVAWLDEGGLLRVGPVSAGAKPGPACFGRGGRRPTLTDAAVVLGHLDPAYFLGGSMPLDAAAARKAILSIAEPLSLSCEAAALAIYRVATENMVQAILDITVRQGIDPANAVLIGGGGAAGFNANAIGNRLGCTCIIIPAVGATLSAAGALLSDIKAEMRRAFYCSTARFQTDAVNSILRELTDECREFARKSGRSAAHAIIEYSIEARYQTQVWEIEVPLPFSTVRDDCDVDRLREAFHASHRSSFGFDDRGSEIEVVTWCATVRLPAESDRSGPMKLCSGRPGRDPRPRVAWFSGGFDAIATPVFDLESLGRDTLITGPALIETPCTTVVVEPGSHVRIDPSLGILITREMGK